MFDLIQDITNRPVFIQFLTTSTSQITFGYFIILSLSEMNNLEIIRNFGQLICIALQIVLPCYFGEKLRHAFQELSEVIYDLKWYEQDIKFQKIFILFLQRTQKEKCLMAGYQIPISLRSFMMVSFSHF